MAKLTENVTVENLLPQSVRISRDQLAWLKEQSERTGLTANAIIRQLIDDARLAYGFAGKLGERLRNDIRQKKGGDTRAYVMELLAERTEQLIIEEHTRSKK